MSNFSREGVPCGCFVVRRSLERIGLERVRPLKIFIKGRVFHAKQPK